MMASAVASIQEEPEVLSVTFTEAGSMGLKFTPNKLTGNTEVLAVNPGTQAERHRELHAGLILKSVGKVGVMGRPYAETLGMLKASGRPVTLTFLPGGTVSASPRARGPAAVSDPTVSLTGKAAAKALQEHIKTSGTGDVQKIARLRRASLVQA